MSYNPEEELKKLSYPVLIINGTKGLQVSAEEANKLKEVAPQATLSLIENMNHVLVSIEGNTKENAESYNEPDKPINTELVTNIVEFIY